MNTNFGRGDLEGIEPPWSGWLFQVSVFGNPFPLFRGKLDVLFFVERCQRPGHPLGLVFRCELLAEEFLKRDWRLLHAASSAHNETIVTELGRRTN